MAEKIRILLVKKKMQQKDLAQKLGCSTQNLSAKLKRDNFSENEIKEIAIALNVDFHGDFVIPETGERI